MWAAAHLTEARPIFRSPCRIIFIVLIFKLYLTQPHDMKNVTYFDMAKSLGHVFLRRHVVDTGRVRSGVRRFSKTSDVLSDNASRLSTYDRDVWIMSAPKHRTSFTAIRQSTDTCMFGVFDLKHCLSVRIVCRNYASCKCIINIIYGKTLRIHFPDIIFVKKKLCLIIVHTFF